MVIIKGFHWSFSGNYHIG